MPATLSKVAATIFFLKKDPKHEKEKPYAFRYAADINIPKTNFELKEYNNVMIEDIRDRLWSFTIEQNGFCVLELSNEIHYEDYFDFTKVETYFHQLESLLKDHLQALSIRKRDPEFPVSSGRPYEFDQPTSVAHIGLSLQPTRSIDGDY
ncbi:MAG: hypothetical protein LQ351_002593 [Letrouitia transgressa]|nr:MAG: hypothetical protein LQ351_002593 [Letrouitia transgressa]